MGYRSGFLLPWSKFTKPNGSATFRMGSRASKVVPEATLHLALQLGLLVVRVGLSPGLVLCLCLLSRSKIKLLFQLVIFLSGPRPRHLFYKQGLVAR